MQRQWWQIQRRTETKARLELDIRECRQTLRVLAGQMRAVRMVESLIETFTMMPD